MPSGLVIPSYKSGFATPQRGDLRYPQLWRGCIGAWNMGLGATGATLFDHSVYGNHGTLTNMEPGSDWVVSQGYIGLDLDGADEYISIPCNPSAFTSEGSFIVWLSTYNGQTPGSEQGSWDITGNVSNNHYMYINNIYDGTFVTARQTVGASSIAFTGNTPLHMVGITMRGGVYTFYQNNKAIYTASGLTFDAPNSTITIGKSVGAAYMRFCVHGAALYNRGLSASEISLLSQRPGIAYETQRIAVRVPVAGGTTVTPTTATLTTAALAPTVTPTVTPTSLTATALGPSSILVDWAHTGGATYFELQRRIKAGA